jgi:hypothetical protein
MPYPVSVEVRESIEGRNRLTVAFRVLLAIPHVILVGGVGVGVLGGGNEQTSLASESGLFGVVVLALAIVSWVTIVVAGTQLPIARQLTALYLRWRVRALAYLMLLADEYPPFGDGHYPAALSVIDPPGPRNRLTVALRLLLAFPHYLVLFVLAVIWGLATIGAWVWILVTGRYPAILWPFAVGVLRWRLRVEAYTLLLVDEYPPLSLT